MDMIDRRALIKAKTNPDRKLEYVITLAGDLGDCDHAQNIVLRYIPDRQVLNSESFGHYIQALGSQSWDGPEDLAVTILTDVNNELIARWVQVSLNAPKQKTSALMSHGVVLEDRQPGWDNRFLLGRLERI